MLLREATACGGQAGGRRSGQARQGSIGVGNSSEQTRGQGRQSPMPQQAFGTAAPAEAMAPRERVPPAAPTSPSPLRPWPGPGAPARSGTACLLQLRHPSLQLALLRLHLHQRLGHLVHLQESDSQQARLAGTSLAGGQLPGGQVSAGQYSRRLPEHAGRLGAAPNMPPAPTCASKLLFSFSSPPTP